ncbi:MAG: MBL fold metallo-hydrolase [Devosiaceae bacterium]|nr:MBL fold metallo-hydrolase [Devosiaceae bacterium MH13]
MEITWLGHAAFHLTADDGTTIITDPYTPEGVGYPPITRTADLVIISSDDDDAHCRADLIAGNPAVINALDTALDGGSASAAGITVKAIEAAEWVNHPRGVPGQNGMYRFELDGMQIAHMGDVGNPLSDAQMAFFEGVDVLLTLAGGYLTIELPDLDALIKRVKPKLVIPMHFRTLTYRPRNTMWIESFLDYYDDADVDFVFGHTASLSKADLPQSTRVLVMDYVR